MRAAKVKAVAEANGLSLEEANQRVTTAQIAKDGATIIRKNGTKARRSTIRQLALRFAIESISAQRERFGVRSLAFWGVIARFKDSTSLYPSNKRGAPRFKRYGETVTMQFQARTSPIFEAKIDLSPAVGESCRRVLFTKHRDIPAGAVVKQIGIIERGGEMFVAVFADVPDEAAAKTFPTCDGRVCGVDPGRKTAISASSSDGTDQFTVTPPILRDKRLMRRIARLARKADRQRRAANPANYYENGQAKRRVKWMKSQNEIKTQQVAANIQTHLINARTERYRLEARHVLSTFDTVGVGMWRPVKTAVSKGKAGRAQTRKDADNALGSFVATLKDYANRSVTPKRIIDVNEAGTTRTCVVCSAATGPTGIEGLSVREWDCPNCGSHHNRDFASAQAIALRAQKIVADTHSVNDGNTSGVPEIQPARRASRRGKRSVSVVVTPLANVPVEQEAMAARSGVSKIGARASATVTDQCTVDARAFTTIADEAPVRVLASEPTVSILRDDHRSHSCTDESLACSFVTERSRRAA